jgi:hypothetical protein
MFYFWEGERGRRRKKNFLKGNFSFKEKGKFFCWWNFTRNEEPGLPDGLFSNQKSKFGQILDGLPMEDVGIFYWHLVHFTVFGYILWTFGIVRRNLVYFSHFGILYEEKSGNPARHWLQNRFLKSWKCFLWMCMKIKDEPLSLSERKKRCKTRGCQIFIGTTYQIGRTNVPTYTK